MRRRSVVTSFLDFDDKILLLRRSDRVRSYPGRWAGVSGSIEEGRTPEQQARIEIQEETGLTDDDLTLVATGAPLAVDDASGGDQWLVHPFRFVVLHPARIHLDWEHVEQRWIDPAELAGFASVPNLAETWARVAPARDE
ncbi:MAG TPA: NUDIX pyrophosphatase [Chloroflexota bacterium]|nr:NUDIX pyrophosphatase [Chloroflexota bacterium]